MTAHHSILKAAHFERRLRWTLFVSFLLHAAAIAALVGRPPDTTKKIYFTPSYTVDLVAAPSAPGSSGRDSGGPTGRAAPLWHGPSGFTSQLKSLADRTHTPLKADPAPQNDASKVSTPGKGAAADASGAGARPGSQGDAAGAGGQGQRSASPEELRFGRYYLAVFNKIQAAWVLPRYGERNNLEAIVAVTIRADGRVVNIQFEKKSGDANFDRSALRAVKKANPLPPLPAGVNEPFLVLGIRFR